ncbi:MAG: ComEC/Rec2 family competence protein [Christensenellales bacterium]
MAKRLTKKQQKQVNKFVLANWKFLLVLLMIIVVLFCVAYYMGWLDILFKDKNEEPPVLFTAGGNVTEVEKLKALEVNFLKVGQADSIVIELPDNMTMMIDTGDDTSDRTIISEFFQTNNITTIDYLLITHSDKDHVGNADWILENYVVRYIFRPHVYSDNSISESISNEINTEPTNSSTYICTSNIYAKFLVAAVNEGCPMEYFNKDSDFSNTVTCGDMSASYTFNFLTPTAKREEISYSDANNFSPIMMLEYAGKRIMFNGDAELENLEEYVTTYGNEYNVDVLKVGHHGSRNATTEEYINAIDPEFAVIQNGLNQTFKHTHQETLDILNGYESGVTIYRTDNNGNITLSITNLGEMSWEFENDDMSKNLYNGTIMLELASESESLGFNPQEFNIEYLQKIFKVCLKKENYC